MVGKQEKCHEFGVWGAGGGGHKSAVTLTTLQQIEEPIHSRIRLSWPPSSILQSPRGLENWKFKISTCDPKNLSRLFFASKIIFFSEVI